MAVYPTHPGDTDVPAQPDFPALERDVLDVLAPQTTPSAPRSSSAPTDREFVFYDGPPFANGLPHYGHLLTGYVKDLVPRYRTMRGNRVERRFGWDCHGLPAEVEAERLLGISGKADIWPWASRSSTRPAASRCCATPGNGRTTSPARPAGSTSTTTTRRSTCPTWRASCGRSSSCGTRAWSTRASRCCPTAGGARRRCPTTSCGWTTTPTPNAATPRSPSGSSWRPGSGCWPGRPRRGRCRPTWPARSARTSATWWSSPDGERYILAADRQAAYERELEEAATVGTLTGAELAGRRYEPLFGLPGRRGAVRHRRRVPGHPVRRRHHRGRHRRGAHGARLRRGRQPGLHRGRASRPC